MFRWILVLLALSLAFPGQQAVAELVDLGKFPAVETPSELGIAAYRYAKDGQVITARAVDAQDKVLATLTIEWPGDQTARIHCATADGRDVSSVWHIDTGVFELTDRQTNQTAVFSFDPTEKRWTAAGTAGTLEELKAREEKIMTLIAVAYADAVTNLGLWPWQRDGGDPANAPEQGPASPPGNCQWSFCDGYHAVGSSFALTRTGCCLFAKRDANHQCGINGNGLCPRCCLLGLCFAACIFPSTLCSCTVEGTACGTIVEVPCDGGWPPECV